MLKKTLFALLAFLLVTNLLLIQISFSSQEENENHIIIKSDGSIDPPNAPILQNENIYTLKNNIQGKTIIIEKDGIILQGNGNKIIGTNDQYSIGIDLTNRKNVIIKNTFVVNYYYGISLESAEDNIVVGNTIKDCTYIVYARNGIDNKLYQNNFLNQLNRVYQGRNVWDNGYPEGGNYWGDSENEDAYSGLQQEKIGSDGISDWIYDIDEDNFDNYPLMGFFSKYSIDENFLNISVNIVSNSNISSLIFNSSNNSLNFGVSNGQGSEGFCRICLSKILIDEPSSVFVDRIEPIEINYNLYDNGTHRWLLFNYEHPSQVSIIPEFQNYLFFIILFIVPAIIMVLKEKSKRDVLF